MLQAKRSQMSISYKIAACVDFCEKPLEEDVMLLRRCGCPYIL